MPICGFACQAPILSRACPIAGFQVLTSQGDFLCYRGESPGDPYRPYRWVAAWYCWQAAGLYGGTADSA